MYVQRIDGVIVGIYANPQPGLAEEFIADDHPDLAAQEPPPTFVTMRQARLALLQAGLLDQVNSMLESIPGIEGQVARIEWEFASEVRRDSPLVSIMALSLNLAQGQMDNLFTVAATL